jgi:hypothetical protein
MGDGIGFIFFLPKCERLVEREFGKADCTGLQTGGQ